MVENQFCMSVRIPVMHLRPKGIGDAVSTVMVYTRGRLPSNALTAERHWRLGGVKGLIPHADAQ